jgi:hypothetical protein
VEEALLAHLLASPDVSAQVGTRVYAGDRPQGSGLPAITIARISGGPEYADEGEIGLDNPRVQIDCWALTYTAAKRAARAVRAALSGLDAEVGGVRFHLATLETERDDRERGSNAAEYQYRVSQDWLIWNGC